MNRSSCATKSYRQQYSIVVESIAIEAKTALVHFLVLSLASYMGRVIKLSWSCQLLSWQK